MKRKIITIDEDKCNGCGQCVFDCPEGALKVINGKARLVNDFLCDGLGACLGDCPEGAISIEEREASAYDEIKTMENIVKGGEVAIKAHLEHLNGHGDKKSLAAALAFLREKKIEVDFNENKQHQHAHASGGCPGAKIIDSRSEKKSVKKISDAPVTSELRQWPIQLKLLNPIAPYFQGADLVITADCVPFSCADFHERFLKDKALVIFCPKLDQAQEDYADKLTEIFKINDIKSVTSVHMEVPCCFGLSAIVEKVLKDSGKDIPFKDYTISLKGEVKNTDMTK